MNYIIRKLFSRLTSGLCNPEYESDTKMIKKYFYVLYGMTQEPIEVQEETVFFFSTHQSSLCTQSIFF